MKAKLSVLVAALVVLLWLSAPAFAGSPAASDADAVHYYVSLGDSLAAGPQAGGDANNYADQLFAALRKHDPTLQLVKLGCGGETTHSMIFRNPCGYSHGSQLDEAVAFLHAHTQFVRLVTIDIGANDLFLCVLHLDQGCLDTALPSVTTNLAAILAAVHDAAGPDVPIVGANYYDPFLAFWFSSPGAAQLTEQMVVQFKRRARVRPRAGAGRRRKRLRDDELDGCRRSPAERAPHLPVDPDVHELPRRSPEHCRLRRHRTGVPRRTPVRRWIRCE
jgi:lysophospholipase L1-like esterase